MVPRAWSVVAIASLGCALTEDFDSYSRNGDSSVLDTRIDSRTDDTVDTRIMDSVEADDADVADTAMPTCTADRCSGRCTSLDNDPLNCGSCGRACPSGEYCRGRTCACNPGTLRCGTTCADTSGDVLHCGDCTTYCASDPGNPQNCRDYARLTDGTGTHRCTLHKYGCGDFATYGRSECPNDAARYNCFRLDRDEKNCGACGKSCATNEVCVEGACRLYRPATECTSTPCTCADGARGCPALPGGTLPICVAGAASCPL